MDTKTGAHVGVVLNIWRVAVNVLYWPGVHVCESGGGNHKIKMLTTMAAARRIIAAFFMSVADICDAVVAGRNDGI